MGLLDSLFGDSSNTSVDEAPVDTTDYTNNPNYNGSGISGWGWGVTSETNSAGDTVYSNGITVKSNGDVIVNGEKFGNTNTDGMGTLDTSTIGTLGNLFSSIGSGAASALKSLATNSKGQVDLSKLVALGGGIASAMGNGGNFFNTQQQKVGYQGGIPTYSAVRQQVPGTYDPTRRPGSRGQEYMTDTQYVNPTNVATAQATAAQQATEMEARNKARAAEAKAAPRQSYAAGGIANLAKGTYLAGSTDGMADKIPATIAGKQPAKLSHGEFVIPADVVSHLGNGNSEAGASRLYNMMDNIRKARTGTTKQGKQINPNKYLPG